MTDTNHLAQTDKNRAEFEAWYDRQCKRSDDAKQGLIRAWTWLAWQAARRASAPASQPVANDNRVMLDRWERDGELKARVWGAMLEQEQEIVRLEKELQALKTQPVAVPAGMEPVATYMGHRHTPAGTQEFWGVAVQPMPEGTALFTAAQVQAMLSAGLAPGWQAVPVEPTEEQLAAVRQKPHPTNPNGWDVNHRRIYQAMLAAAPSGPAREPLTDEQIEAAWDGLQARRALKESADFRARIGVPCSRCEGGTYRADHNGYSQFHRCNKCRHVPMWEKDGREFGITAAQNGGQHAK